MCLPRLQNIVYVTFANTYPKINNITRPQVAKSPSQPLVHIAQLLDGVRYYEG